MDIRVYYEDTDAGGVVYYANYLKFCERARTELLRSLGFENKALMEEDGLLFVVRHIDANYKEAAKLDDVLTVRTHVAEIKNVSFVMNQQVFREDALLFDLQVRLACINLQWNPSKLPDSLKQALEKVMG